MNVLVTGATGSVGPAIVRALEAGGHNVRTLSLNEPDAQSLPSHVEALTGDVTEAAAIAAATRGMDGVLHLAGLAHRTEAGSALDAEYWRVNAKGTAHVVEAALRARVQRVVMFSTIAVYGPTTSGPANESTAPNPDTPYARSKLAAEELLLAARTPSDRPLGTVLRMAAIYGGSVKGNYLRLVRSLARRRFLPVGQGQNRRTLVHEDDAAEAALIALTRPEAAGQVYNVTDGTFHTLRDINAAICQALGRRPPRMAVPLTPALWAVRSLERTGAMLGLTMPITAKSLQKYSEDVAVEGDRIQRDLGYRPRVDLLTGWRLAVDGLRQRGFI